MLETFNHTTAERLIDQPLLTSSCSSTDALHTLKMYSNSSNMASIFANKNAYIYWSAGEIDKAAKLYYQSALHAGAFLSDAYSSYLYCLHFLDNFDWPRIVAAHKAWGALVSDCHLSSKLTTRNGRRRSGPLRVGFVSPCFREHIQGYMIAPLIREFDANSFQTFGYYTHTPIDAITREISQCFDVWRHIRRPKADYISSLAKEDNLDILIDLNLHMSNSCIYALGSKPALVNATWLGYPGISGLNGVLRLWDKALDTDSYNPVYNEPAVELPDGYWYFPAERSQIALSEPPYRRNGFITFGCLNNPAKTTSRALALWCNIMALHKKTKLAILMPQNPYAQQMFKSRIINAGITWDRVIPFSYSDRLSYLSYYSAIDIALDTFPYNGHTTTLDALWMGVPVVSLIGETPVGRAGLSILGRLGFSHWLASDEISYVNIASTLVNMHDKLPHLRRELRYRMLESPLVDAKIFSHGLQSVLSELGNQAREQMVSE